MYTEEEHSPYLRGYKKKKSKKGLHGTDDAKGKTKKGTGRELAKPFVVVGGLLLGNFIGKGIDKFIPVSADAEGMAKMKKAVKPLVQAGLGVGVILLSREKSQDKESVKTIKEFARSLGYGVAGSGVISTVKLIKADLFEGLGDTGDSKPIEAKYYREAKDEIMKMLQDNSFKPALPEANSISSLPDEAGVLGLNLTDNDNVEEAEII